MRRASLRSTFTGNGPVVTPLAHDALAARLIERAGFRAFAVGGSAMLASRFGIPDIGLAGLAEMSAGIADIAAASALPFLADGDDGYGDVKSVVRTVEVYERMGVGAILFEDQRRDNKQQRAESAKGVVDIAEIAQKLQAAMAARSDADTMIVGRTDAYGALGLDEALRRAERFLALGVDAVFVAGLKSPEDYARVGRELRGALLSAAIFEGVGTPWLSPSELWEMGFSHVSFPASLLFRAVAAMEQTLVELRRYADGEAPMQPSTRSAAARAVIDAALDLPKWKRIEADFPAPAPTPFSPSEPS